MPKSSDDKEKELEQKEAEVRRIEDAVKKFPSIVKEYTKIKKALSEDDEDEYLDESYNLLNDVNFIDFAFYKYKIIYNKEMFIVAPIDQTNSEGPY